MSFSTPGTPSAGIDFKEVFGSLAIIDVNGLKPNVQTVNGVRDAIEATVVFVDGPQAGIVHDDTLIFPKVLVSQLKGKIGQKVLGRIAQGTAKPGQNAPWQLVEATPQDVALGEQYLAQAAAAGLQTVAAPVAQQAAPVAPVAVVPPVAVVAPPTAPMVPGQVPGVLV